MLIVSNNYCWLSLSSQTMIMSCKQQHQSMSSIPNTQAMLKLSSAERGVTKLSHCRPSCLCSNRDRTSTPSPKHDMCWTIDMLQSSYHCTKIKLRWRVNLQYNNVHTLTSWDESIFWEWREKVNKIVHEPNPKPSRQVRKVYPQVSDAVSFNEISPACNLQQKLMYLGSLQSRIAWRRNKK